ncbi:MAG: hypothetical protein D6737_11595 [Chloroflexi bacterium]|nr:MAG: hypothetical protein D6737_11595 [Chloroflexota bacterium]
MAGASIFEDEWRECLREQFMYVIRNNDTITEQSLTLVLHEVGFTDDELRELRLRATMHVDDVSDDFVPDFEAVAPPNETGEEPTIYAGVDVANDAPPPTADELEFVDDSVEDEEADAIEDELADLPQESDDVDDEDDVEQLSLF